jgi:hypothetical protein
MFRATVEAICETVVPTGNRIETGDPSREVCGFVLSCFSAMPKFLAFGLRAFTVAFSLAGVLYGGQPFSANSASVRQRQWQRWRTHPLGPCRDLVRFYESLATLAFYSRQPESLG